MASKEQLILQLRTAGVTLTKAQLKKLDTQVQQTTASMGAMGTMMKGMVGFAVLGAGIRSVVKTGMEFDQAMKDVQIVTKGTDAVMRQLEKQARALGASTEHTASSIAGLQKEYGKLGFTAPQIQKVTQATLSLASVTGADLVQSATVAGATLRGFGMEADEMGRVVDVMAVSFSNSALDMDKFSESMKYVAPIAAQAGVDIEGATAILGKLADAGIDGSMAGTSLRKILLEAGREGSKLADRMGGPITSMEDFSAKMKQLKAEGLDPLAEGTDLVGQRAVTAFSILLESADDVDVLTESLREANGQAQEMADRRMDTLAGDIKKLESAFDDFKITLFDMNEGVLRDVIQSATDFINSLDENRINSFMMALKLVTIAVISYRAWLIKAKIANIGLMATMRKTPWGFVAMGATLLIGKVIELSGAYDTAGSAAEAEAEAELKAMQAQEEHERQIALLTKQYENYSRVRLHTLKDEADAQGRQAGLLKTLNKEWEDNLYNLDLYKDKVWDLTNMDLDPMQSYSLPEEVEDAIDGIENKLIEMRDADWSTAQIRAYFEEWGDNLGNVAEAYERERNQEDLRILVRAKLMNEQIAADKEHQRLLKNWAKLEEDGVDISDERLANLDEEIKKSEQNIEVANKLLAIMDEKDAIAAKQTTRRLTKEAMDAVEELNDMQFETFLLLQDEKVAEHEKAKQRIWDEKAEYLSASNDILKSELDVIQKTDEWKKASDEERKELEKKSRKENEDRKYDISFNARLKLKIAEEGFLKENGTIMQQYAAQKQEQDNAELERLEALKEAYGGFWGTVIGGVEMYAEKLSETLNTSMDLYSSIKEAQNAQHQVAINNLENEYNTDLKKMKEGENYKKASTKNKKKMEEDLLNAKNDATKKLHNKIADAEYEQAKVSKWVNVAQIAINTAVAVAKALPNYWLAGAVGVTGALQAGIAASTPIPPPAKMAQFGMNEVIDSPTNLMVGEGNTPELVQVTPLVDENRFGPTGGGVVNITFEGNVLSDDFIIDEAIPKIREAVLRGESLG